MSSEHSDDSLATGQRKCNWRASKVAEQIWKAHGFDTMMDESLVNSWVNLTRRLSDDDYRTFLTYTKPPSHGYWDISISPNSKFFPVFQYFDSSLPDENRLPMEFERLNLFHAKHGSEFEKIWSNDRLDGVKNYKVRKFMKVELY